MTEFIMLSTIGVSKVSELRAAKILQVVADSHEHRGNFKEDEAFFEHSYNLLARRWKQLREAVNKSKLFRLTDFPPGKCSFGGRTFTSQPGKFVNISSSNSWTLDHCIRSTHYFAISVWITFTFPPSRSFRLAEVWRWSRRLQKLSSWSQDINQKWETLWWVREIRKNKCSPPWWSVRPIYREVLPHDMLLFVLIFCMISV